MAIRDQLMNDVKTAMREKDQAKLDTLRFLQAAIKKAEIDARPKEFSEEEVIQVLKKMVKQRHESIDQFKAAGRQDLVDKETQELTYLETYLPAQMPREQVERIVTEVMSQLGVTQAKQMGQVMKEVMARTGGQADNKVISEIVKSKLS